MRCPKCHYLSFEPEPRCRNCGYDLALEADLPITTADEPEGPRVDLDLLPRRSTAPPVTLGPLRPAEAAPPAEPGRIEAERPPAARPPARPPRRPPAPTTDLPLFVKAIPDTAPAAPSPTPATVPEPDVPGAEPDESPVEPLIRVPPAPRPPLAVRRSTPDAARLRSTYGPRGSERRAGPLEHDLLDDLRHIERAEARAAAAGAAPAGLGRRLAAGLFDTALLAVIDAAAVWLTLRQTGLAVVDWAALPLAPTAGFLLLLDLGYLTLFTAAGGQTPGKMLTGVRVVADEASARPGSSPTVGQALARALVALPGTLAAGLGCLPALVGRRLAVHDRLARTRVIDA